MQGGCSDTDMSEQKKGTMHRKSITRFFSLNSVYVKDSDWESQKDSLVRESGKLVIFLFLCHIGWAVPLIALDFL